LPALRRRWSAPGTPNSAKSVNRPYVYGLAWCAPRFGELTELRRKDINLDKREIHVQLDVVRVDGQVIADTPMSDAGTREVASRRT
jgi:hypothetical protein